MIIVESSYQLSELIPPSSYQGKISITPGMMHPEYLVKDKERFKEEIIDVLDLDFETFSDLEARELLLPLLIDYGWVAITVYGNGANVEAKENNRTLGLVASYLMNHKMIQKVHVKFTNGNHLYDIDAWDIINSSNWSDLRKDYRFASLSKEALNVIIEPLEPFVQEAANRAEKVMGDLFKNVKKIKVHPETGVDRLGHVERGGENSDPQEIHIYKNQIDREIQKFQGSGIDKKELLIRAIMSVLAHEVGHIGKDFMGEQFRDEAEAERFEADFMSRASWVDHYEKQERQDLFKKIDNIVSGWDRKLEKIAEKYMVIDFEARNKENWVKLFQPEVLRLYGLISYAIGPFNRKFSKNLAEWQKKSGLEITGLLDEATLVKFQEFDKQAPIRNFGVVMPMKLYRGGILDEKGLEYLQELGVQRIVSLHEPADDEMENLMKQYGFEVVKAYIKNGNKDELGRQVLGNNVKDFLTEKPTYIHCYFGQDRTGGVIARFRTEQGWPCKLAYKEAKYYGFKDMFADLIDWFSELCEEPPVDTDRIREQFGVNPYEDPEKFAPGPRPTDAPYVGEFNHYPVYNDSIANLTPYTSLTPSVSSVGVMR